MIAPEDRQPIVVADAGPLIRLAAAGLLGSLRGLNRRIVLVDRVEDEVVSDSTKPYAREIAKWIADMGEAVLRAQTVTGIGIDALRRRRRTPEEDRLLKSTLRNSGELALREFVENWRPADVSSALVLYEDRKAASLFLDADFPLTLMTTRAFARALVNWGVNADAVGALEKIANEYDLKPALVGEIDPAVPADQRVLPQPML